MAQTILPRIDKNFYKKCSPEETIHRIREILYKCGIYIMELSDTQDGFYHSHLHIANKELLQFGIQTNGKGMTPAYSLASAYAEMMERLQNAMLIGGRNRATRAYLDTLPADSLYRKKLAVSDSLHSRHICRAAAFYQVFSLFCKAVFKHPVNAKVNPLVKFLASSPKLYDKKSVRLTLLLRHNEIAALFSGRIINFQRSFYAVFIIYMDFFCTFGVNGKKLLPESFGALVLHAAVYFFAYL